MRERFGQRLIAPPLDRNQPIKTVTLGLSGHARDRSSLLADLPPTRWQSAEQHRPSPACAGPVCSQIPGPALRDRSRPLALWLRPAAPIASVAPYEEALFVVLPGDGLIAAAALRSRPVLSRLQGVH